MSHPYSANNNADAQAGGRREGTHQVITNLILNALAAVPEGGTIDLQLVRNGSGSMIDVHDTGIGCAAGIARAPFRTVSIQPALR